MFDNLRDKIGIPSKLYNTFSVKNYIKKVNFRDSEYSAKSQSNALERTLKDPFSDSYVLLLSSESNNITAQMGAKLLLEQVLKKGGTPFWFNILNYQKEFVRLEDFKNNFNGIDYLIIDGLFAKTNINYLDALRLLLSLYQDIPICVIISGTNGIDYFKNQVFCGFNRFVHFGDDQKVKIETNIDGLDDLPDLS